MKNSGFFSTMKRMIVSVVITAIVVTGVPKEVVARQMEHAVTESFEEVEESAVFDYQDDDSLNDAYRRREARENAGAKTVDNDEILEDEVIGMDDETSDDETEGLDSDDANEADIEALDASDDNASYDEQSEAGIDDEESDYDYRKSYRPLSKENEVESVYDTGNGYDESIENVTESSLLRKYINPNLPSLRNQNPHGTCWAFGMMAMAEINSIKKGYVDWPTRKPDYSELHTTYFTYNTVTDPLGGTQGDKNGVGRGLDILNVGGNYELSTQVLANWVGAANESVAPYSNALKVKNSGLDPQKAYLDEMHVENIYISKTTDTAAVKQLISDYGAVCATYYDEYNYYHSKNNCYYYPYYTNGNHAITLVGWDDDFAADRFGGNKPDRDGAFLVRNSWTTGNVYSHDGYFWISYYDKSLAYEPAYAFDMAPADKYDNNYHYDGAMETVSVYGTGTYANVFTAHANDTGEYLKAVSFFTYQSNVNYEISVYKNLASKSEPDSGIRAASASGITSYAGYYTVELDNSVGLGAGEEYSVVVKLTKSGEGVAIGAESDNFYSDDWYSSDASALEGQSYIMNYWDEWEDYGSSNNANLRIKAFTVNGVVENTKVPDSIHTKNDYENHTLELIQGMPKGVEIVVDPSDANRKLTWSSSNPQIVAADANGILKGLKEGAATITVASSLDGSVKTSFEVTVVKKLLDMSIERQRYYETVGDRDQVTIITTPRDYEADSITFKCSDERVATIDENGYLTCIAPGEAFVEVDVDGISKGVFLFGAPHQVDVIPTRLASGNYLISWKGYDEYNRYELEYYINRANDSRVVTEFEQNENGDYYYIKAPYDTVSGVSTKLTVYYDYYSSQLNGDVLEPISEEESYSCYVNDTYKAGVPGSYNVSYNKNGGTSGTTAGQTITFGRGTQVKNNGFIRNNCEFYCWNTKADGSGIDVYPGDNADDLVDKLFIEHEDTINLYAQWGSPRIKVTLDSNGGSCDKNSIYVCKGEIYNQLPDAVRTGYVFAGWFTEREGGQRVDNGDVVKYTMDAVLYAHWTAVDYNVSFNAMEGILDASEALKVVHYGKVYGKLPVPRRENYDFAGWYDHISAGSRITADTLYEYDEDTVLYARWKGKKITVTFDLNDSSNKARLISGDDSKLVYYNEMYGVLPVADKNNYTFIGWFDKDGRSVSADTVVSVTGDHVLHAEYESNGWGEDLSEDDRLQAGYDDPADVPDRVWVGGVHDAVYTGSAVTFDNLNVYDGLRKLIPDTDYTVKYSGNVNAASKTAKSAPSVTITGKGRYTGKITIPFTISPLDLGDRTKVVVTNLDKVYNGRVQKAVPSVAYNIDGKLVVLKSGRDYTLSYIGTDAYQETGGYVIKIVGKGNYEGTYIATETIVDGKVSIDKVVVDKIPDQKFDKNGCRPPVTLYYNNQQVSTGDYTCTYYNNHAIGTGMIVIKANPGSEYVGSRVVTYKITGSSMKDTSVELVTSANMYYDRQEHTPGFTIVDKKTGHNLNRIDSKSYAELLHENPEEAGEYDCVYSYSNNINKGNGVLTVTGINSYAGTITRKYEIGACDISDAYDNGVSISHDSVIPYQKGGAKLKINIMYKSEQLIEGRDYTVKYYNNSSSHNSSKQPYCIVTGKNNFCGSRTLYYSINVAEIDDMKCQIDDVVYARKAGNCNPKIAITDVNGAALKAGTDYNKEVTYTYSLEEGERIKVEQVAGRVYSYVYRSDGDAVAPSDILPIGAVIKATISGKGNYNGSTEEYFRVTNASVTSAKIVSNIVIDTRTDVAGIYADNLVVTVGKNITLTPFEDYEIAECALDAAGKYMIVTIRGLGNYGGYKTVRYKINVHKIP